MSTTKYRYVSGVGQRVGFTDNQGYNIGITPITFTAGSGTTSMSGTFSVNTSNSYTYVNLQGPLVGTANIVINATQGLIGDNLQIMVQGGSATQSVVLSGNISAQTVSVGVSKTAYFDGQFNGTEFIGTATVQS